MSRLLTISSRLRAASALFLVACLACARPDSDRITPQCALTAELGILTLAPELDRAPTAVIKRSFSTQAGPLVLGDTLPVSERAPGGERSFLRMKEYVVDPASPTFVTLGPGDTIRAVFVAFPSATPYVLTVDQFTRGLGAPPTFAEGEVSRGERWRSAQWQSQELVVRVDSFAVNSNSQICMAVFER